MTVTKLSKLVCLVDTHLGSFQLFIILTKHFFMLFMLGCVFSEGRLPNIKCVPLREGIVL